MTNRTRKMNARLRANVQTLICWEFMRGKERMSCQVDVAANADNERAFAVIELPYQRLQRATVEVFQSATAALRRHAALASDLRAMGWKLVAYTS